MDLGFQFLFLLSSLLWIFKNQRYLEGFVVVPPQTLLLILICFPGFHVFRISIRFFLLESAS